MTEHISSIRETKAHLSKLALQAARGVEVTIARHGQPMAKLGPVDKPRQPITARRE